MKYTHIFFDLDHTIWDFERNSAEALADAFAELEIDTFLNINFEDFLLVYKRINQKYWERFRKGFISRADLRWKRMQATFLEFKKFDDTLATQLGELYLEKLPTKTHLFSHAKELLAYCQNKNYEMHLITNGFEETQNKKLNHAGIASFFDVMVSSERAMAPKPSLAIFEYAMNKTNALASKSLMIGDHYDVDIVGARNAGMDQVYFNPKKRDNNKGATFEVACLSELYEIL